MKTHKMGLQPKYYDFIKNGSKRIELRLYDEKRQMIQIGDIIEFARSEQEALRVRVVGLLRYSSFGELVNDFDIAILADASMSKQELLEDLAQFYTPEKQAAHSVLGIRFELI